MRASQWEYLGYVLVGVGTALLIAGSVTLYYSQGSRSTIPRYSSYSIPLIVVGVCLIVLGIVAFVRSRTVGKFEVPPPPPPPLPLPPPPP